MKDINKRVTKPDIDRSTEVRRLRDAFIAEVYGMQYTIKEIGDGFNMSHQNVWKIIVKEKAKS